MKELTESCINWIKKYFEKTKGENAIVGMSGGKDSTVVAALCKEALGEEHVIGVMMPNDIRVDNMNDAQKVCDFLKIKNLTVDIRMPFDSIRYDIHNGIYNMYPHEQDNYDEFKKFALSQQALINLAPRIRMATLYAVAQSIPNGRVANTSNACEVYVGYGTLFGDTVGDFAPLRSLTCSQIYDIGDYLGIPYDLVHKVPADGLTGKTDEEVLGVTYNDIENVLNYKTMDNTKKENSIIFNLHTKNKFKREYIW